MSDTNDSGQTQEAQTGTATDTGTISSDTTQTVTKEAEPESDLQKAAREEREAIAAKQAEAELKKEAELLKQKIHDKIHEVRDLIKRYAESHPFLAKVESAAVTLLEALV